MAPCTLASRAAGRDRGALMSALRSGSGARIARVRSAFPWEAPVTVPAIGHAGGGTGGCGRRRPAAWAATLPAWLATVAAVAAAGCSGPSGGSTAGDRRGAATPPAGESAVVADAAAGLTPAAAAALASDGVVATVDGVALGAAAAFHLLLLSAPDEANNAVRQLVLDRLAAAEAHAHGIAVPAAALERELPRLLAAQERKVAEATRGKRDLTAHVRATWGLERDAYDAIARASLERSLLLERVVLHELSRHPRVQLRLIRVKEQALAEELARKLEQGADFAALARQHSEDGSARDGGLYPPLPTDLPSPLFDRTEGLAPGARSPVHEMATVDGPRWRIVEVLARLAPDERGAAERAAAIEALLEGRGVAPPELEAWMRIMESRHEIRFLGLKGEGNGQGEAE
ncbi:MAG: peptidylprolyl isomerase [Planctomycetes bacterium]|nr:peptidylprolyl isomerase [Planctomycetota bacterium]